MILVVCIDSAFGMMFGGRRQSRDRIVAEQILAIKQDAPLYVTPYSAALFPGASHLVVTEDPCREAETGAYYFAEDGPLPPKPEGILLYRWNRLYPADRRFVMPSGYRLVRTREFQGFSHDTVTEEYFERSV